MLWSGFAVAPVAASLVPTALERALARFRGGEAATSRRSGGGGEGNVGASLAVAVLLALFAVAALPWLRPMLPLPAHRQSLLAPDTPVAATEALLSHGPPGRLFTDMQYGSYLLWRLPGGARLFVDPRIELYPYRLWLEYGTISRGSAPDLLDRYEVGGLLVSKERQGGLLRWVTQQPGWQLVCEDDFTVVLLRN